MHAHPSGLHPSAWPLVLVFAGLSLVGVAAAAPQTPKAEPSKFAGTWTWSWRAGDVTHRHNLEVEGAGKALAAREIFDEEAAVNVSDLKFEGDRLQFTVVRGERKADYKGKLAGKDAIEGTVTTTSAGQANEFPWKAERKKATAEPAKPKGDTPGGGTEPVVN